MTITMPRAFSASSRLTLHISMNTPALIVDRLCHERLHQSPDDDGHDSQDNHDHYDPYPEERRRRALREQSRDQEPDQNDERYRQQGQAGEHNKSGKKHAPDAGIAQVLGFGRAISLPV